MAAMTKPMIAMRVASGPPTREAIEALYATGHELHTRGMYAQAAAVFRIMVLTAPHDERGYVALGSCHEGLGQEEVALSIYEAGIDTAATSAHANVARGRLLLGCDQRELADAAFDEAETRADIEDNDYVRSLIALERRGS